MVRGDWNRQSQSFEVGEVVCSVCGWRGVTGLSMCYRVKSHRGGKSACFDEVLL